MSNTSSKSSSTTRAPRRPAAASPTAVPFSGALLDGGLDGHVLHPIFSALLALTGPDGSTVPATTSREGKFSVSLPCAGRWKINTRKEPGLGSYEFEEVVVDVPAGGLKSARLVARTDPAKINAMFLMALINTFTSINNIAQNDLAHLQHKPDLSFADLQGEVALLGQILDNALLAFRPTGALTKEQHAQAHKNVGPARAKMCSELEQLVPKPNPPQTEDDRYCCSQCPIIFAGNQAAMQNCYCCRLPCRHC